MGVFQDLASAFRNVADKLESLEPTETETPQEDATEKTEEGTTTFIAPDVTTQAPNPPDDNVQEGVQFVAPETTSTQPTAEATTQASETTQEGVTFIPPEGS